MAHEDGDHHSGWRSRLIEPLSRLRPLIALAVAFGLTVPALILAQQEGAMLRREAFSRLNDDLIQATEVSAEGLREALWQVSPDLGAGMGQAIFRDDRILRLLVIDTQRNVPFMDLRRPQRDGETTITRERNIFHDDVIIGKVHITMSTDSATEMARAAQGRVLLRTVVGLLFSLLLIFVVMHLRLVRPIEYLKRMSARLADRNLSEPIRLNRGDELGQLARSLETTRLALFRAFSELEARNKEIVAYADGLEVRVAERTSELAESNERLSEVIENLKRAQRELVETDRLASLGRMVAGIAHELNTPLGSSLTVVSTLLDHHQTLHRAMESGRLRRSDFDTFVTDIETGLHIMQRNVQRAADMVDKFRQVAVDQTSEQRRHFEVGEIIDELQMTLSPRLKHSPIAVHVEIEAGLHMDSFPGPLGQVMTNLELNALMHAFEGRERGNLWISGSRLPNEMCRMSVRDDGVGMTDAIREHIFDPFFTTRLGRGGSGLGLAIVYNIVTGLLGGKISVVTTPGLGSEFVIEMPLNSPQRTDKSLNILDLP